MRNFLRLSLPDYMIPSVIVSIDAIPLTPNGKIDRAALPNPFANNEIQAEGFVAPSGGVEEMIAGIWQELLDIKSVSANDNFFELGGHSLLAVRVSTLVEKRTGQRLDPRRLFFQTLRQIAGSLAERRDLVS